MSKQSLRNRDIREFRDGMGALKGWALLGTSCCVFGMLLGMAAASARAGLSGGEQDQSGAGVMVSKQATAKDVGLPVYPGARAHKDEKGDSPALQLGMWGGSFGFKLAVMKMESSDTPEKIAEFYKKALAKYGTVLNCSDAPEKISAKNKTGDSKQIDCADDKPEKGGFVFKAGTKEKQHIVGVQPNGQGSVFQLVYMEARGDDKEKKAN